MVESSCLHKFNKLEVSIEKNPKPDATTAVKKNP